MLRRLRNAFVECGGRKIVIAGNGDDRHRHFPQQGAELIQAADCGAVPGHCRVDEVAGRNDRIGPAFDFKQFQEPFQQQGPVSSLPAGIPSVRAAGIMNIGDDCEADAHGFRSFRAFFRPSGPIATKVHSPRSARSPPTRASIEKVTLLRPNSGLPA